MSSDATQDCTCSGTIPPFLWGSTAPSLPGRSGAPHCNMRQEKTFLVVSKWVILLTGNLSEVKTIVQNISVLMIQLLPRGKAEAFVERRPVIQHKPSPRDLAIKAWDKLEQAGKINPEFTDTNSARRAEIWVYHCPDQCQRGKGCWPISKLDLKEEELVNMNQ